MKTLDGRPPYFKLKGVGLRKQIDTNILALDIPTSSDENPIVSLSQLGHWENDKKITLTIDGNRRGYIYPDGDNFRILNTIPDNRITVEINGDSRLIFEFGGS